MDLGGILWIVIDILAVIALAGALVWGTLRWRRARREPELMRKHEQGTRENYRTRG